MLYALAMADADQEPGARGAPAQAGAGAAASAVQGVHHAGRTSEPSQENGDAGASEPGGPCNGRAEPGRGAAESAPAAVSRQDSGGVLSAAQGRAALALYLESVGRCAKERPDISSIKWLLQCPALQLCILVVLI